MDKDMEPRPVEAAGGWHDLVEAARAGAPHGTYAWSQDADGSLVVQVVLVPGVPMAYLAGVPYVATLAVCEALRELGAAGVGIGWPFEVVGPDGRVAGVGTTAGYGDGGMFVVADVALDLSPVEGVELPEAGRVAASLRDHMTSRVDAWAAVVNAGGAKAGPISPVASDYYDALPLMGQGVEVVYPNGRVFARGTLAGLDMWGRVTVRNSLGRDIEFSHEQAGVRRPTGH